MERSRNCLRSKTSGGTHWVAWWSRKGSLMKRVQLARPSTGLTSTAPDTQPDARGNTSPGGWQSTTRTPLDVFAKVRNHERPEQLEAAKEQDLLPYFRLLESQAGPVVEMEGRETIMLGSNNYLGLTSDERVKQAARDALESATAPASPARGCSTAPRRSTSSSSASSPSGWDRGRDRLHHRLPVEPGGDQRHPRAPATR